MGKLWGQLTAFCSPSPNAFLSSSWSPRELGPHCFPASPHPTFSLEISAMLPAPPTLHTPQTLHTHSTHADKAPLCHTNRSPPKRPEMEHTLTSCCTRALPLPPQAPSPAQQPSNNDEEGRSHIWGMIQTERCTGCLSPPEGPGDRWARCLSPPPPSPNLVPLPCSHQGFLGSHQ